MAKQFNPQAIANKWASNLGSATQAYTEGVNGLTETPGQAANRNVQGYLSGVQQAVSNGSYQAGNNSYTLSDYKAVTTTKGAQRLASGAQAGKGHMQSFLTNLAPVMSQIEQIKTQNPRGSYEQNMARQRAVSDLMHSLKGQLKGK